jgi:hypothetical protein
LCVVFAVGLLISMVLGGIGEPAGIIADEAHAPHRDGGRLRCDALRGLGAASRHSSNGPKDKYYGLRSVRLRQAVLGVPGVGPGERRFRNGLLRLWRPASPSPSRRTHTQMIGLLNG